MSGDARLGTGFLVRRHLRSGALASVLVAVLVAVTVLVVALAPRALAHLATEELRFSLGQLSPLHGDLTAEGDFGYQVVRGAVPTTATEAFEAVTESLARVPEQAEAPLAGLLTTPDWVVRTAPRRADRIGEPTLARPVLALAVDPDWESRVRIVEGALPADWSGSELDDVDPLERPPIEIALSVDAAGKAGLSVGDVLDYRPAPLRIAGLYEPLQADDGYWGHAPDLSTASQRLSEGDRIVSASVYVGVESAFGLRDTVAAARITAWYAVDASRLDYPESSAVASQLQQIAALGRSLPSREPLVFSTGFPDAVVQVHQRVTLVTAVLLLSASGPLGVVLAVFALAVQSVLERRRPALALASARGGGSIQLRTLMVIEGLVVALPAVALGLLAANWAMPVTAGWEALAGPLALALTPAALFGILASPGAIRRDRVDLAVRARGGARRIVEVVVIAVGALSLYLLFRRGLAAPTAAAGIDPLIVVTPLSLALAACVVVLRVYPALLLAVQLWARRRRGAVQLLGAARAVRAPALGFAATLALVVGISMAVFSTGLATTLATSLRTDARNTVGADVRVEASELGDELVAAIRELDGVAGVSRYQRVSNVAVLIGDQETILTGYFVDSGELHGIRSDVPLLGGDGRVQIAVSADLERLSAGRALTVAGRQAETAATMENAAMPDAPDTWFLADFAHAAELGGDIAPDGLLVGATPGFDGSALATAVAELVRDAQTERARTSVRVMDSSAVFDDADREPVIGGTRVALAVAVAMAVSLSALAVVLASIAAARTRNRLLGVLRILGMSPRQLNGVVAWELAPVAAVALLAGTVLGVVELWVVMGALDLSPFIRGGTAPAVDVQPGLIALVTLGFAAVVTLAGALAAAIGRRHSPASSIKIGAE